jgi:hypothetical protein
METKGGTVYLIGIPSNTSCVLSMLTSTSMLEVVCAAAVVAAQIGRGAMCTLVSYAAATDAEERGVVGDPLARVERGERRRRYHLLA